MKKRVIVFLSVFLTALFFCTNSSYAYTRDQHDTYMCEVLFKSFSTISSPNENIRALAAASYLSIDQFNGNGASDLEFLRSFGVEGLPSTISEIDFLSNSQHRKYTHRGWDYTDITMQDKWPIRKNILLNTADKIFDFESDSQKEAFCKVLYYIHLLGDREQNTKQQKDKKSYKVSELVMEVGGTADNNDIISGLMSCIEDLFRDQRSSHKYRSLYSKLSKYNRKYKKIVGSIGGVNSMKKVDDYYKLTQKVIKLLTYYFPEMLKEEEFFSRVFY